MTQYSKPRVDLAGAAVRAIQNPDASKHVPMFQDNVAGEPASYGTQPAYAADE